MIVSSDLTWSKHIEVIVAKADKTLGLIKRLLKDTSDLKYQKDSLLCTREAHSRICVQPMVALHC